jgi:hypothetical protein
MKKSLLLLLVCVSWTVAGYAQEMSETRNRNVRDDGFARWQYRLQGGYVRRIARISDQVAPGTQDYLKKMKSGYTFGGDIHYFVSEPLGFGVKYTHNGYQYTEADFKDKIRMNYFALSGLNRLILRSEDEVLLGVNVGYQSYRDQLAASGAELAITGGTLGAGVEIGYAFRLSPGTKAFLNLALISGTITKVNVETGGRKETVKLDKDEFEGLGRLELTLGLRFGK